MIPSINSFTRSLGIAATAPLITCATVLALSGFSPIAIAGTEQLVERLEQIEAEAAPLCPFPPDRRPLGQAIDELVDELGSGITVPDADEMSLRAVSDLLFKKHAILPSRDLLDPCNLLPSAVLERKQGYCVGIAAVYLAVAEKLGLPIQAVATPSHVFLRYDDGKTRVNIETFSAGASVPDDQYVREQKIAPSSIRKGVFLRDLTADGFLAQVRNNLGVVYSERRQFEAAEREYRRALDLNPLLAAAWYNWGNDLLQSGDYSKAINQFTRSLKLHPNDVWALNNRGVAFRKIGKDAKARRDFEAALRIEPGFQQARRNLEGLSVAPGSRGD